MQSFLELYGLRNFVSEITCCKNLERSSSTDLILTKSSSRFQKSCALETDLSDFHKMTITVMKTTFQKLKPKLTIYRDYSMLSNDKFREELLYKLSMENISNTNHGLENVLPHELIIAKLHPIIAKCNNCNNSVQYVIFD